jgi:hypothetical protein
VIFRLKFKLKSDDDASKIWIRCTQNSLKILEGAEVSMQLRGLQTADLWIAGPTTELSRFLDSPYFTPFSESINYLMQCFKVRMEWQNAEDQGSPWWKDGILYTDPAFQL